jgi:hypothetical protein
MAKTAIVSGSYLSAISRGDDPPYPPTKRPAPDGRTTLVPGPYLSAISRGDDPPYPPTKKGGQP